MLFEMFINFDGDCREAVGFYANVFKSEVSNLMTYGQMPPDPTFAVSQADKVRILYAGVKLGDITLMFSDIPTGSHYVIGNNINPTISFKDKNEVIRVFNALKAGGEVFMDLQKTFFSELYCMVKDKFGIIWQINYYANAE